MNKLKSAACVGLCFFVWFTPDAGAVRLKGQAVTWADFSYINHIASSINRVYFATTGGITRFNKIENCWELPLTGAAGFGNEQVKRIWVEQFDERLYVQTEFGFYEYDVLFDRWYPIDKLPQIETGCKHVATPEDLLPSDGIMFIDGDVVTDMSHRRFVISDILDDGSGNLWIGTWGNGAGQAGSSARLMQLLPYGLLQNRVNAIYRDDSLLWISGALGNSYHSGVSVFHPERNEFFYIESGVYSEFSASDVNCLEGDAKWIYIGTAEGLYVADRARREVVDYVGRNQGLADFNVLCLRKVGDSLFLGTARGLDLLDFTTDSIKHLYTNQFSNRLIYDLDLVDNHLWIASGVGAYRLSLETGKLQKFNDPHGVLFSRVYDVEHYGSRVWLASDGGVLSLDINTGATEPYADILRRVDSRALAVNDSIVAVASDVGMTIIFLGRTKSFSRDFTTEDGLASNYVYSLVLDGDYIWIGTDRGLTRFLWNNPERVD